jgi:heme/copper-type cytochrome/quinol oxidase subunit 2
MSRNQRIGLLVAAVVVAAVAIVVAVASGGDDSGDQAAETTQRTQTTGQGQSQTGTEQPHETLPAQAFRLQIKGGQPVGGVQDFKVKKGDKVTIVVSADAHDVIHLHGYDIEKDIEPGKPATFKFTANIEGIFDIESHVAEDQGREPQMGKLTVEPD